MPRKKKSDIELQNNSLVDDTIKSSTKKKPGRKPKSKPQEKSVVIDNEYEKEVTQSGEHLLEFKALNQLFLTPKQSYEYKNCPTVGVDDTNDQVILFTKNLEPVVNVQSMPFDDYVNHLRDEMLPGKRIYFGGKNFYQNKVMQYRKEMMSEFDRHSFGFYLDKDKVYLTKNLQIAEDKEALKDAFEMIKHYEQIFSYSNAFVFSQFEIRSLLLCGVVMALLSANINNLFHPILIGSIVLFLISYISSSIEYFVGIYYRAYNRKFDSRITKMLDNHKFRCDSCNHECEPKKD